MGSEWASELTAGPCLLQGLFVQLVKANSPASLVGLRFGDQILQIDGRDCAGWNTDRAHRVLKRASAEKIVMVVRDRWVARPPEPPCLPRPGSQARLTVSPCQALPADRHHAQG